MKPRRGRVGRAILVVVLGLITAAMGAVPGHSAFGASKRSATTPAGPAVRSIRVADVDELHRVVSTGVDLAEYVDRSPSSIEVHAIVTPAQVDALEARGFEVGPALFTRADWQEVARAYRRTKSAELAVLRVTDDVTIMRADYFKNKHGRFLSVEAKTSSGDIPDVTMTAEWNSGSGTPMGSGGSASMDRFSDAGVYMYHRVLVPVDERPSRVKVVSSEGGRAGKNVVEWLPDEKRRRLAKDFITNYMNPTEVYDRIESLADRYPRLTEIVELPHQTHGYRRKAQAVIGQTPNAAVVVDSVAWGHDGGNDLSVEVVDPGTPNSPLTVTVAGDVISVSVATSPTGQPASTAAHVSSAIDSQAGSVVDTFLYRNSSGSGIVQPHGEVQLSDGLDAPPSISRDPFTVRALRIGRHQDGTRTGVLIYSQEHAREWVTPLVSVEAAERLLANYAHDDRIKRLVDNLDIFIIPSVNPDGGHYSFFDFNFQRKNLVNYCPPGESDLGFADSWGVDINRNYEVGSLFDGYFGASTDCTDSVYSGPAEHSEAESKNVIWLADQNPNIRFSMNVHSYGGYFMWSPGAYEVPGRVPLLRPTLGEESYFWDSGSSILRAIKTQRRTVIWPGQTGPVIDVLYSAAGNSSDELWYDNEIFAWNFEVGADVWNPSAERWEPVGFQPPFQNEGHQEALEFATGVIRLLRVAHRYAKDESPPSSSARPAPGSYSGSVGIRFVTSEPADIYYTLDGSRPTLSSTRWEAAGLRESGATITLDESTTVRWFAIDVKGNRERVRRARYVVTP
jgi:Zinc carboxypeptidase/Chitobiase/beta-hexosaminidase C-terminal domain